MKYAHLVLTSFLVMSLAACADTKDMKDPINSMRGMKVERERRLATAASDAIAEGKIDEALPIFERRYGKKPDDRDVAVNYAQLLRKSGKSGQALGVLEPFVEDDTTDGLVLTEYAAALLETGQTKAAQDILNAVIADPKLSEFHADAKNQLGISYAAENRPADAEAMFRDAWEGWRGDATSVMNNLGLAQANQGKYDAALVTLRRALALAPHKTEIARNIDIISDLRDNSAQKPPARIRNKKTTKTVTKTTTVTKTKPAKPAAPEPAVSAESVPPK